MPVTALFGWASSCSYEAVNAISSCIEEQTSVYQLDMVQCLGLNFNIWLLFSMYLIVRYSKLKLADRILKVL